MIFPRINFRDLELGTLPLITCVILLCVSGAWASERSKADQADILNKKVMVLYEKGSYAEAVPLALQALELRENLLGSKHPNVAVSLNNLGLLYASLGEYYKAEKLYLRALDILQTHLGSDHPHVEATIGNLETLYELIEDQREKEVVLMV